MQRKVDIPHADAYDSAIAEEDDKLVRLLDTAKPFREFLSLLTLQAAAGGISFYFLERLVRVGWSDTVVYSLILTICVWWKLCGFASVGINIYTHRAVLKLCKALNVPFWPHTIGRTRRALWEAFLTALPIAVIVVASGIVWGVARRTVPPVPAANSSSLNLPHSPAPSTDPRL
jgi:hypothetical protein